jgi:hypothetical protein
VQPLTPMQMAVSLKIATTDPGTLPADPETLEKKLGELEKSAKSLANFFPQPGDNFQVGVSEALAFANNEAMQKELLEGSNSLAARLKTESDPARRADLALRTILCRQPRPEEIQTLAGYMQRRNDHDGEACRQIVWALLTSAEFRFNH